jgi:hypothetical protein
MVLCTTLLCPAIVDSTTLKKEEAVDSEDLQCSSYTNSWWLSWGGGKGLVSRAGIRSDLLPPIVVHYTTTSLLE